MKHGLTKNAFGDVNTEMTFMVYVYFPFLFINTYSLPVLTKDTKCPNQLFNVRLVHLHTICAK
jgi:hypothetical protein